MIKMEWQIAVLFTFSFILAFLCYEQGKTINDLKMRNFINSHRIKKAEKDFSKFKNETEEEIDELHNVAEMQGDAINGLDEKVLELDKVLTTLCSGTRLIMPLTVGTDSGDSRMDAEYDEEYEEDEEE